MEPCLDHVQKQGCAWHSPCGGHAEAGWTWQLARERHSMSSSRSQEAK